MNTTGPKRGLSLHKGTWKIINPGELKARIWEAYPILKDARLELSIQEEPQKRAWVIRLKRGHVERYAFLDAMDAERLMRGEVCLYLGVVFLHYARDIEDELKGGTKSDSS